MCARYKERLWELPRSRIAIVCISLPCLVRLYVLDLTLQPGLWQSLLQFYGSLLAEGFIEAIVQLITHSDFTQSQFIQVGLDCVHKMYQMTLHHALHVQDMMDVNVHMSTIYSECMYECM